jgi:hypothetical protein
MQTSTDSAAAVSAAATSSQAASSPRPATEVSTDPSASVTPSHSPQASACERHRGFIEESLRKGRNAMAIWQDLVDDYAFEARYASVRRYVAKLRGGTQPEGHPFIVTAPGEEAQVDYGEGPMVRHPETRKYRRTRLFVLKLGYSRKSVRLLVWNSGLRSVGRLCYLDTPS